MFPWGILYIWDVKRTNEGIGIQSQKKQNLDLVHLLKKIQEFKFWYVLSEEA